ncbi:MAG TPA: AsmA-like C-terminal region-containing protein [Candidatus Binataceae bacterium]|nr:AsmA-like C-terminal region-containing protein [Candidatus Binataceae bacterium]
MRLAWRIALFIAAFVASIAVGAVAFIYFNQHRIILAVLESIHRQAGIEIVTPSSHLEVRDHIIVVLDHPRVMSGDRQIVSLASVRAVVNFHSLVTRGLPLHELDLVKPVFNAPFATTAANQVALPRPDRELIDQTLARMGDLAQVSRRLVITDLELRDITGAPLLSNADLVAYHRRATPDLWHITFRAVCDLTQMHGVHAAGDFRVGEGGTLPAAQAADGTFWYWQLPLQHLAIGNLDADGDSNGKIKLSVAHDATLDGLASIGVEKLTISSPDLSAPLALGDYTLQARFSTSQDQVTISNAKLAHAGKPVADAQAFIEKPFAPNPQLAVGISDLNVAWKDVLASVRAFKRVPQSVQTLVRQVKSGQVAIAKASLTSPLIAWDQMSLQTILSKLSVNATVTELSFAAPADTQIPDVTGASVQIFFAKRTLSLTQGSARVGNSELHDVEGEVDLTRSLTEVPYRVAMKADLDLGELRPATMKLLEQLKVGERDRLQDLQGIAHVDLDASGTLRKDRPTRPEKYLVQIEPHSVTIGFRGAPGPIGVASGNIIVQPDLIKLERVSARATGGTADFDGELRINDAGGVQTRGLRIDMHQMPIERWLEGLVDPDDFSAQGSVGGEILVTGDRANGFLANGKLTLLNGRVQFGFLRAPLLVHPAILTIRGRTLTVSMPAAELEKSPIDFNIGVQDVSNPSIRIDAKVQKLDVEVMKFVRLPWMPPTPTHPPTIPISGHVDAREANLETFAMTNAKTDFKYHNGDWSVDNLTASSYGGHLAINLAGRQKDDWIRMFGKVLNLNVASLFLLNRNITRAPMSGHLDLTGDLWADTGSSFFATMAGTAILKMRDGNLDKFPLLSRLLELIDLRSWITAKVPDPRVSGIPFRTVTADFKGDDGSFYTDDLLLDGPAIDIVASGSVDLDKSALDMKIGMIPFGSVNWLVSHIPLVGKNVAGSTKSIIAAYFNARGPISNPRVTPAPITSVAELFKKTLGLPINLIKPDTIK